MSDENEVVATLLERLRIASTAEGRATLAVLTAPPVEEPEKKKPTCWQKITFGSDEERYIFDALSKIWLQKELFRQQQRAEELENRTPEQRQKDHEEWVEWDKGREERRKIWEQREAQRQAAESTRMPAPDAEIRKGSFPHMAVHKYISIMEVQVFKTFLGNWRCVVTQVNRDWDNVYMDFHSQDFAGLLAQMHRALETDDDERLSRAFQEALPEEKFWND